MRLLLAPLLMLLTAAAEPPLLLREQSWTTSADLAHALTHAPQECAAPASLSPQAQAGRALFRAPVLLGGPAARAGLSCNACHSNGRANAAFLLPELTDRAGAADVTSEWSSRVRGDGRMNPIAIPDLAGVNQRSAFGHAADPSLEHFVEGVILEEFQGETSGQTLPLVLAYLRTLDDGACASAVASITLVTAADDVRLAFGAAQSVEDWPTASRVLAAAQDAIGRIVERLPARGFQNDRQALAALSRELTAMRTGGPDALAIAASGWRARFDAAVTRIARRERRTYFNEAALRAALAR